MINENDDYGSTDYKKLDDADLLRTFDEWEDNWRTENEVANDFGERMRRFLYDAGGQWDDKTATDQEARFKSTYENNAIRSVQMQIEAEMREFSPEAVLMAAKDNLPTELIQTKIGLYKQDCYVSNTPDVYTQAFINQCDIGYGAFRLTIEEESPDSFNTVLRYKRVKDAMDCFWDPYAPDPCKQEGDYAGFRQVVSLARLQRQYEDVDFTGDCMEGGPGAKNIEVKHIYCKNYKKVTLIELDNGHVTNMKNYNKFKKELEKYNEYKKEVFDKEQKEMKKLGVIKKAMPYQPIQPPKIVRKRKAVDWTIMHYIRTRKNILEKNELKVKRLPIVYVPGNIKIVNGKEKPLPWAMDAMTPQELLNYVISNIIDNVDRSLGVRVLMTRDSTGNYADLYDRPENGNSLPFDPQPGQADNGKPTMIVAPAFDPNLLQLYNQCKSDISMTLGRSPENSGQQSNTHTFGGILLRQMAGDKAVGVLTANLMMSIGEGAKTYLDWQPYTYDTERTVQIRSSDGQSMYRKINHVTGDHDGYGNFQVKNDMKLGEFSIEAYGGPSFAMQRLAAIHLLMQLMNDDPSIRPIAYDLLFKELPFSFANELSRRAKEVGLVSPQIVAEEKGEKAPQQQPSPQEELMNSELQLTEEQIKTEQMKQKTGMVKAFTDAITKLASSQAHIATAAATEASAYAKSPLDPIEDALQQSEQILSSQTGMIEKATDKFEEMFMQPEEEEDEGQSAPGQMPPFPQGGPQ